MQFYLCQTPEGEQLAPTQADAKALDKGFVPHDVPTGKTPLMDYVNGLLRRVTTATVVAETDFTPVLVRDRTPKVPNGCPNCDRNPMGAKLVAQSATALEIEERIDALDQDYLLRNIIEAAQNRLNDLQQKEAA